MERIIAMPYKNILCMVLRALWSPSPLASTSPLCLLLVRSYSAFMDFSCALRYYEFSYIYFMKTVLLGNVPCNSHRSADASIL